MSRCRSTQYWYPSLMTTFLFPILDFVVVTSISSLFNWTTNYDFLKVTKYLVAHHVINVIIRREYHVSGNSRVEKLGRHQIISGWSLDWPWVFACVYLRVRLRALLINKTTKVTKTTSEQNGCQLNSRRSTSRGATASGHLLVTCQVFYSWKYCPKNLVHPLLRVEVEVAGLVLLILPVSVAAAGKVRSDCQI